MINIEVLSDYNRSFPDPQYPFLRNQCEEWRRNQPLKGVRILHNLVNSFETLIKIEALMHAGAELTLTRVNLLDFPYQEEIDSILLKTGIPYIPNHADIEGEFDIGMDCAAQILKMPRVKILKGCVELTQVGAVAYKNSELPYPVISVDDSNLKKLECMYGTGESFIRAFNELTNISLKEQKVVLFGFGKIGNGIVNYLYPLTKNIIVVEKSEVALKAARSHGLKTIDSSDLATIREHCSNAFAVVTATGIRGMLSSYLNQGDIGDAYIANMGVDNEIGENFSGEKILFGGAPINFSLKHPTLMRYFDPICFAHNLAAKMLIESKFEPGFHPFAQEEDERIVNKWQEIYGEL